MALMARCCADLRLDKVLLPSFDEVTPHKDCDQDLFLGNTEQLGCVANNIKSFLGGWGIRITCAKVVDP